MRSFGSTAVVVLLLSFTTAFAESDDQDSEPYVINNESVPFMYETQTNDKTPHSVFAYAISEEFRNAKEEFTRYDLIQELQPVFKENLSKARKAKTVEVSLNGWLFEYDFEKSAFPIGIGSMGPHQAPYVAFDQRYSVRLTNIKGRTTMLPVKLELARKLARDLEDSREIECIVTGRITGTELEGSIQHPQKIVNIEVDRIVVKLVDGPEVGSLDLPSPSA